MSEATERCELRMNGRGSDARHHEPPPCSCGDDCSYQGCRLRAARSPLPARHKRHIDGNPQWRGPPLPTMIDRVAARILGKRRTNFGRLGLRHRAIQWSQLGEQLREVLSAPARAVRGRFGFSQSEGIRGRDIRRRRVSAMTHFSFTKMSVRRMMACSRMRWLSSSAESAGPMR